MYSITRRTLLVSPLAMAAVPQASAQAAKNMPPSGKHAISLAAWSFSGSFFQGYWKLLELPAILSGKLGIHALEHVNQFFENPTLQYLQKLKKACADHGVRSTILMVDNEGPTASPDAAARKESAVAHRKWIDIAHYLGCHSMRCNVYGGAADWKQDPGLVDRAAETMLAMLEYAKGSGVDVIVENHGGASSDPHVLVALVKKVNHPNFGLLCDLGNWNKGADRYANSKKILPYARGLSVKGTWGENLDPAFDAEKLVRVAYEGGYTGYWGLEVTPGRPAGGLKRTTLEQFNEEVKTVLGAKAIVERVVMAKG
jgi:L-ribulose-5-phosphate 3-epimerase